MGNMIKVLIVDDNVDFGDLLEEYMCQMEDIKVVGVARDGVQAIDLIITHQPDVVVLDIVMPHLDGIGVLEKVSQLQLSRKPTFFILSAIGQDVIVQNAIALGAEYYMIKPLDMNVLIARIRQIYCDRNASAKHYGKKASATSEHSENEQKQSVESIEAYISSLMMDFGLSPHMIGYQYVREAILEALKNPKVFSSITKVLYPTVAHKFGTTPQRVERAIRNAIEKAWQKQLHSGSSNMLVSIGSKPTNSEFIAMLYDRVRIKCGMTCD